MSELMSALGVAGAVLGVGLPAVSDALGRRPVMVIACALGMVGSAAALFYSGPLVICAALLFVGCRCLSAIRRACAVRVGVQGPDLHGHRSEPCLGYVGDSLEINAIEDIVDAQCCTPVFVELVGSPQSDTAYELCAILNVCMGVRHD